MEEYLFQYILALVFFTIQVKKKKKKQIWGKEVLTFVLGC